MPEVPIFDADIEPLLGNVNPFRVGANRNATNRAYHVTFEMAIGDPVRLNGDAFKPPAYRAPGNTRYGGAIVYQGPWGDAAFDSGKHPGHKRGVWDMGQVWLRYYAPDKDKGAKGGVPVPRVTYELADGRRFVIAAEEALARDEQEANRLLKIPTTKPEEPRANLSSKVGWEKMWGIPRSGFSSAVQSNDPAGRLSFFTKPYIRDLDKGVFGRGEKIAAPGNYEPSASTAAGINYLGRGMSIGAGKVFVLTGKLPTTPRTRNGEALMSAAQARYWSLTSYDLTFNLDNPSDTSNAALGAHVTSLMDDEMTTDNEGWYTIVYSRPEDRPANATAGNGVTWVDWGPVSYQGFTLRWMSIAPEWTFERAPDEANLGRETDFASDKYDAKRIARNNREGFLGDYQPLAHYMSREEFERIGATLKQQPKPVWQSGKIRNLARNRNR